MRYPERCDMDIKQPNSNTEYLGPICKFGPGGEYISDWPAVPLYSAAISQPNPLGRVLEMITRMIGKPPLGHLAVTQTRRQADADTQKIIQTHREKYERAAKQDSSAYAAPIAAIGNNSPFSGEPTLFRDHTGTCVADQNKPNYRVRASRRSAKKRSSLGAVQTRLALWSSPRRVKDCLNSIAPKHQQPVLAGDTGGLPLVGRVAAGRPIDAIEHKEHLSLATHFGSTDEVFALEVIGDSMIDDGISSGDYVICRRSPAARDGQLVIAIVDDDGATLKRFYKEPTRVRLEPANQNYAPIYTTHCRIEAVVVGLLRKF